MKFIDFKKNVESITFNNPKVIKLKSSFLSRILNYENVSICEYFCLKLVMDYYLSVEYEHKEECKKIIEYILEQDLSLVSLEDNIKLSTFWVKHSFEFYGVYENRKEYWATILKITEENDILNKSKLEKENDKFDFKDFAIFEIKTD